MENTAPQIDMVNRPPHYMRGGLEAIDVIERYGLSGSFHIATAIRYLLRAGHKGPSVVCLKKARWYIERWIDNDTWMVPCADADAEEWRNPIEICIAFELQKDISFAVASILDAALGDASDQAIIDALKHIDDAIVAAEGHG